jgi:hypothetical protein
MSDDKTPPSKDNQTLKTVKTAKAAKEAATRRENGINWKTAAGVGIGSAAILAALLYANKARNKKDD